MKKVKLFLVIGLVLGMASLSIAAENMRIATVADIKGTVEAKTGQDNWVPATLGMTLKQGDAIRVGKDSSALLNLDGQAQTATVTLNANSQLELAELITDTDAGSQKTLLDLSLGSILIKAAKLHSEQSSFEVKTPTSMVGVRGTTFAVTVEAVE